MAFWSGETLEKEMPNLVSNFDKNKIDCASYTLSVGSEVYITPDHDHPHSSSHTKLQIKPREGFTIPAGQFGFILTEEEVEVPHNAIAFISMKAKIKFQGLINVSGFHVDPGYKGQIIFAVFNAGPSKVHLERGMPLFLIWYASLDTDKTSYHKKEGSGYGNIPPELINNIPGEIYSFQKLLEKIEGIKEITVDKVHKLEKIYTKWLVVLTIVSALFFSIIGGYISYQLRAFFPSDSSINVQKNRNNIGAVSVEKANISEAYKAGDHQKLPTSSDSIKEKPTAAQSGK